MGVLSWNADFTEVLADRLRELRKEKGLSWDSLAETLKAQYEIQIHRDTLKFYEAKKGHSKAGNNRAMKAEYLYCLADFYGVSVDYLLGRTDTRSPDADIKAVCEFTGLSEQAVTSLKAYSKKSVSFISEFLEKAEITHIALLYENLKRYRKKLHTYEQIGSRIDKSSTTAADLGMMKQLLNAKEQAEFDRWKLERSIMTILDKMMEGK